MSRDVLDQIYKLYGSPRLDYGGIIYHRYDPEFKLEFTKGLESTQYSAALAVNGAWRGANTDKLYEELGWEILYYRKWYRRLRHFCKLRNDQRPSYLHSEISQERNFHHNLRMKQMLKAPIGSPILVSRSVLVSGTNWMNLLKVRLQSLCSEGNLCA